MQDSRFLTRPVSRHRLENGLTVLLRPDHSVPVVTSMIWYQAGSRHETDGLRGVSHLLEHLMFKGTDRFAKGEIDDITTRLGGSNNAFTSIDSTAYYFSFASDRWLAGLDIEASRMRGNTFDPREFEMERKVVIEELKMDLDDPWGALRQQVEMNSFASHPYRYPVIGLLEDLRGMSVESVADFYRAHYAPDNAVLVLAGDFGAEAALREVERRFAELEPSLSPNGSPTASEPPRRGLPRAELRRPARVSRLMFSFPSPAVDDPDYYAMQVIDRILSEGKLGRFYRRLVEDERLVASASSEISETHDRYLLLARFELRESASAARAEERILREFEELGRHPVGDEELRRAKNQCRSQALLDFETTLDQATQLGTMETLCGYERWSVYFDGIRSVGARDVLRAARRFLDPDLAAVGVLPRGGGK